MGGWCDQDIGALAVENWRMQTLKIMEECGYEQRGLAEASEEYHGPHKTVETTTTTTTMMMIAMTSGCVPSVIL
jgi:hypothetical protein